MARKSLLEEKLREIQSNQKTAAQRLSRLRNSVREGKESTGDPIKDHIIVAYGPSENPEIERSIREIQRQIMEHQKEPILVVLEEYEERRSHGCVRTIPSESSRESQHYLGVLNGTLSFDLKKGKVLLPTERYVTKTDYFSEREGKWKEHNGDITLSSYDFDKILDRRNGRRGVGKLMVIGQDELELFYHTMRWMFDDYYTSSARNPTNALKYALSSVSCGDNSNYIEAMELLGVKPSPELMRRYDENRKKLYEKTLHEIIENVRFENKETVRETLQNALRLKLHTSAETQEILPGLTLHIGKYITGRCNHYNIKIPN